MNYSWDSIILDNFIKASQGNLEFVSKDGKVNEKTNSSWCAIQDNYIQTLDSESIEIKRYKAVCFKYATALREWLINPIEGSRKQMEVNKLFIQKTKMAADIFTDEKIDWDSIISKATIAVKFRIISTEIRAKEFFNIIKNL